MKILLFIVLVTTSNFCSAATGINVDTVPDLRTSVVNLKNILYDRNRTDFSVMDRLWLFAKAIHPRSNVGVYGDTLVMRITTPHWIHDTLATIYPDTSIWPKYVKSVFAGMAIYAFGKDNCKFKYVVVDVDINGDSSYSGLFVTAMLKTNKYTFEEKLRGIISLFQWPTYVAEVPAYRSKTNVVLYHGVDTATAFSDFISLTAFYQISLTVINDIFQKADPNVRKAYGELLSIFHSRDYLLCYARSDINNPNCKRMYQTKYYETALREIENK